MSFWQNSSRSRHFVGLLGGAALLGLLAAALWPVSAAPIKEKKEKEESKEELEKNRKQVSDQLKKIGLALHNYHDTVAGFPPPAITNNKGKALLSWRVAILPYLGEQELYKQFKLDERWDSKHNKALLKKMPQVYQPVSKKAKKAYATFFRPFVGNGAAFEPNQQLRIAGFTDGTSNTIFVVEAGEAVPWTKPDEIPYNPKKLPKLGAMFGDGFYALFADGSVHFIKKKVDPQIIHALITRAGGEVVGNFD
jgi:Protein of unknown function (DUF1559)